MEGSLIIDLAKLRSEIHTALRAWRKTGGTSENLLESLLLVEERRADVAKDGSPTQLRLATNQVLLDSIEELASQDETAARVLRLRFPEDNSLLMVANKLNVSEHTVSRLQRAAIERLGEIIHGRELAFRETRAQTIEAYLPPPSYTRMFGLDDICAKLSTQLIQKTGAPWVIAIVGIGGIGKTALADNVTRQVIRQFHFDEIIWLRIEPQTMSGRSESPHLTYEGLITDLAQRLWPGMVESLSPQQRLVQVRQALKAQPHLVIIDNLESETDTAYLLDRLNDLAQPSKFLLTSRTRLSELATVFNFPLDELSLDDAADLIHHHAGDIGVTSMITVTEADIGAIYEITGGNPLALKLVVSLLDTLPLPQILINLKRGQQGSVEELYRHIYWQTWQILSVDARSLLKAMPLVAESGGTTEYLRRLSSLSETQLWPALQELRNRSLLEVRGTAQEKQYGIHRLTETFLHTEIIHWPEVDSET
ncbi:MAG: NB-ARC domain-containing protein [Nitrososphaera sp.]|nr:NB-ARC domain-containing protein [Nitrososphaera sp.]